MSIAECCRNWASRRGGEAPLVGKVGANVLYCEFMVKPIGDHEANRAPSKMGRDSRSKPLPKVAKLVAGVWLAVEVGGLPLVVILPHGRLNDGELTMLGVSLTLLLGGMLGTVALLTRLRGGRYLLELTSWAAAGVLLVIALFLTGINGILGISTSGLAFASFVLVAIFYWMASSLRKLKNHI